METVAVTKEVPKDSKEVVDLIVKVADHFLQKKPWTELMNSLPQVITAVDGWENVVESFKGDKMGETVGYLTGEIAELFEQKKTEEAAG